ncbi:hypothetical protein RB195_001947 [Necator americanus]|uniref:Uncharacterized protein n=1 Tax=Necator americanus TaxID=51031 RepID=A0ABR1DGN9_NECAM
MAAQSRDATARLPKSEMKNLAISSRVRVPLRFVEKIEQCREEGHVQTKPYGGRKRMILTNISNNSQPPPPHRRFNR